MKVARILFTAAFGLAVLYFSYGLLLEQLTLVNPNYVELENGERGYYMNIENMAFAALAAPLLAGGAAWGAWMMLRKLHSK